MNTHACEIISVGFREVSTVYAQARQLLEPFWAASPNNPRHVLKRVSLRLIEACSNDSDLLIGVSLMRRQQSSVVEHSLRCGIFVAAMTSYLGLPKRQQCDIVLAALAHHIGQDTHGPYANNRGALAQRSLLNLLLYPIPDMGHYRQILAAFQHELGQDGTGEPRLAFSIRQHPVSAFLTVANDLAMLCANPSTDGKSHDVGQILSHMSRRVGSRYHPSLFALLARVVGPFPVGTLLRLSDQRNALVVRYRPSDQSWSADALVLGSSRELVRLNAQNAQVAAVLGMLGQRSSTVP
ncbi:MAG: hypothetical protein RBU37_06980 [Myxococcota bacterium]|jgi:HD-GYP domain-containing protein (c-di-GMP phosphodiesterase class II)|nr:hypothetical protein [Myxococcota bacterium]